MVPARTSLLKTRASSINSWMKVVKRRCRALRITF
jgi:hypothetical protein